MPMAAYGFSEKSKQVYQRGRIACRKCGSMIYIHRLSGLPDEVSLRCPRCGERGIYASRAIIIEDAPERRRKPRR